MAFDFCCKVEPSTTTTTSTPTATYSPLLFGVVS